MHHAPDPAIIPRRVTGHEVALNSPSKPSPTMPIVRHLWWNARHVHIRISPWNRTSTLVSRRKGPWWNHRSPTPRQRLATHPEPALCARMGTTQKRAPAFDRRLDNVVARLISLRIPLYLAIPLKKFNTGRGCVHSCAFCWNTTLSEMYGKESTRRKSPKRAVDELWPSSNIIPQTIHFS